MYLIHTTKILKFCEVPKNHKPKTLKPNQGKGYTDTIDWYLQINYKKLTNNLPIINLIETLPPQKIKTYPVPINVIKISNT